jgi:hypothetical protein
VRVAGSSARSRPGVLGRVHAPAGFGPQDSPSGWAGEIGARTRLAGPAGRQPKAAAEALAELVRRRELEAGQRGAHAVGSLGNDWSWTPPRAGRAKTRSVSRSCQRAFVVGRSRPTGADTCGFRVARSPAHLGPSLEQHPHVGQAQDSAPVPLLLTLAPRPEAAFFLEPKREAAQARRPSSIDAF